MERAGQKSVMPWKTRLDNPPANLPTRTLLIELLRDCPGIWVDLGDHVQGRIDFQNTSYVSLLHVSELPVLCIARQCSPAPDQDL